MLMIEALNIHKSFQDNQILCGIDLTVKKGEVVALIGPSGAGKSTFLRCLNKLETINQGTIRIAGETLVNSDNGTVQYPPETEIRRICSKTGMVFQQFNLFPHMTVLENLMEAPLTVQKRKKEDILPEILGLLEKVGLSEKKDVYPARLSGGQQQRVAIARALAMKPEIMLFDEPTSSLDPELTGEVLRTMLALAKEKMTMVVVTHEMGFAREAADRVLFLDQGELLEQGPPADVLQNPQHPRLQAFLANLL
jgi:ABC-type polar amino acid transport system, ATPase component